MKRIRLFLATLAFPCLAFSPCTVLADDDLAGLDVTMEVLDDESDFEDLVPDMRRRAHADLDVNELNDDLREDDLFEDDEDGRDEHNTRQSYTFEEDLDERDEFDDDEDGVELDDEDDFEVEDGDDLDEEDEFDDEGD